MDYEEVENILDLNDGQGYEAVECIAEAISMHGQNDQYTVEDYVNAGCAYESDYILYVRDIEGNWEESFQLEGY